MKCVNPTTWPDGISGPLEAGDWSFAWGDMAPIIDELLLQDTSAGSIGELYVDDFVIGGGMGKPSAPTPVYTAYYYTLGYELGSDWKVIDTGDPSDPYERLGAGDMFPEDSGDRPATGLYQITSFNRWSAEFILLDKS